MTNGVTYNLIYKGNECSEKQSAEGLKSTWVAQSVIDRYSGALCRTQIKYRRWPQTDGRTPAYSPLTLGGSELESLVDGELNNACLQSTSTIHGSHYSLQDIIGQQPDRLTVITSWQYNRSTATPPHIHTTSLQSLPTDINLTNNSSAVASTWYCVVKNSRVTIRSSQNVPCMQASRVLSTYKTRVCTL